MLTGNQAIAADVALIQTIPAVPEILRVVCEITGMKFAVIARVTATNWTACAVLDQLGMGVEAGQELDIGTTFCQEVRASRTAIVIDSVDADPRYREHLTPKIYGFQSYISVPIVLPDGDYFGSLCTLDRRAINVSDPRIRFLFLCCAGLLAEELQRARTPSFDPGHRATSNRVANLRSVVIAMLTSREPCGAGGAGNSAAGHLSGRLTSTLDHTSAVVAEALALTRSPICAGSVIHLHSCTDLSLRLRAAVIASRLAHPDQQIISNIAFGGPVYCDPEWIQRLAFSMLGSALRHADRASAVSFVAKVKANSLLLSVWNHGNALSPQEIGALFRPNWRSMDDPATAGAAMHTCAEVVRVHLGTIHATSSPSDGTQLTARIPLLSRTA